MNSIVDNNLDLQKLIDECIAGKKSAYEQFYKQYYSPLMGIVKRYIQQYEIAEEVLHNAFIKIFKNLNQFENRGSFDGWLKRITFHAVSDYIRSSSKYRDNVFMSEEPEVYSQQYTVDISSMDYNNCLKLINELPEKHRIVFNMFAIDGFSHKEISQFIGISDGTSKWYLSESRKILQEKFRNYFK